MWKQTALLLGLLGAASGALAQSDRPGDIFADKTFVIANRPWVKSDGVPHADMFSSKPALQPTKDDVFSNQRTWTIFNNEPVYVRPWSDPYAAMFKTPD